MKPIEGIESVYQRKPPDVERIGVPRGELCIVTEWCKGCGFCIEFCTKEVLATAKGFNQKGYHPPEVVKPEACTLCNTCEMICPDFAIFTVKLEPPADGQDSGTEGAK
jgi:2-oxoglutarate ferredoxin oxidoreductase subunit delta